MPGAISWASARRVIASPTTACTSESRRTVSAPRSGGRQLRRDPVGVPGSASQAPSRLPMPTARSRWRTTSSERKFSPTNSPSDDAQLVLLGGDDRGVRDGQAERVAEEGGDREPVGERADHAGLGGRGDIAAQAPAPLWDAHLART